MELRITNLTADEKQFVRDVVSTCMRYWPNAHLGDDTPRQDMRRSFSMIRTRISRGVGFECALNDVMHDAYRHADM